MKNFIAKNRIVISIVVYLALVGLIFYLFVSYLFVEIDKKNTLIQKNIIDQERKEKRISEIPKMKEQYQMVLKKEKELISLITEDKAVALIEELEKLAERTGNKISIEVQSNDNLVVNKIKNEKQENSQNNLIEDLPSQDHFNLKINLQGNYNQLLDFIEKFEALPYYSDIVSLDIKVREKENPRSSSPFAQEPAKSEENKNLLEENVQAENILNSLISAVFYIEKENKTSEK